MKTEGNISTRPSEVLTLELAALYLGTTPRHLRRLYSERRIPFIKVGRFVRFRRPT